MTNKIPFKIQSVERMFVEGRTKDEKATAMIIIYTSNSAPNNEPKALTIYPEGQWYRQSTNTGKFGIVLETLNDIEPELYPVLLKLIKKKACTIKKDNKRKRSLKTNAALTISNEVVNLALNS